MRHNDLWDVVHRLVYCPIAKVQNWISRNKQCIEHLLLQVYEFSLWKVASTSWFGNFLSMAGVELSQLPHVLDLIPGLNRSPTYQNVHGRFDNIFIQYYLRNGLNRLPTYQNDLGDIFNQAHLRSAGENWEGGSGGRGIRALTRCNTSSFEIWCPADIWYLGLSQGATLHNLRTVFPTSHSISLCQAHLPTSPWYLLIFHNQYFCDRHIYQPDICWYVTFNIQYLCVRHLIFNIYVSGTWYFAYISHSIFRHIYQPPPASDLEQLTTLFMKNQGFMLVNYAGDI